MKLSPYPTLDKAHVAMRELTKKQAHPFRAFPITGGFVLVNLMTDDKYDAEGKIPNLREI